jgi:hypothetical protein
MAGISPFGRKFIAARAAVFLLALMVLIFTVRVNTFTGWFFHADKFPFGLSIATLLMIGILLLADLVSSSAITGRAQFQCISLGALSVFWLAFNAFATSRYVNVPYNCASVFPDDELAGMRSWCVNVHVVKGVMWVEWVFITLLLAVVGRFVQSECAKGNSYVLRVPLCRYDSQYQVDRDMKVDYPFAPGMGVGNDPYNANDFSQYEKTQEQNGNSAFYQTQRYESPSTLQARNISEDPVTPTYYAEASGLAGVGVNHYQKSTTSQNPRQF